MIKTIFIILIVAMVFFAAMVFFLDIGGYGAMKTDELKNRLKKIAESNEDEEICEIAKPIRNTREELIKVLLELLNDRNERTVYLTKALINQMNYLLLPDLVCCDNAPDDIWGRWWFLNTLVDDELCLREDTFKKLFILLEDKRLIPFKRIPGPESEESIPEQRVCDAAFLALKRLLNQPLGSNNDWGEEEGNIELELILEEERFLDLVFSERDKVIEKQKRTDYWCSIGKQKSD